MPPFKIFSLPEVHHLTKTRCLPHLSLLVGGKPLQVLSWKHHSWLHPVKGLYRPQKYHCYLPGFWVTLQKATMKTKWYEVIRKSWLVHCAGFPHKGNKHGMKTQTTAAKKRSLTTVNPDENFADKSKAHEVVSFFFLKEVCCRNQSC